MEKEIFVKFSLNGKFCSHCEEHEHADGGSDDQYLLRDEEGQVGDGDK